MAAGNNDISHSFTDLMTSLAVIFILLLVATLNNALSDSDQTKSDLQEVTKELEKLNLTLTQDPDDPYTQIINLDENKVKFNFMESKLLPEGKEMIGHLFNILTPRLCDDTLYSKLESVIIEGHTDKSGNNSVEGKLKNVRISQDRAYAVLLEAFSTINSNTPDDIDCLRRLASATGRGSSRLLLDKPDDASRRVEVKIRVKPNQGVKNLLKRSGS